VFWIPIKGKKIYLMEMLWVEKLKCPDGYGEEVKMGNIQ
jgi:hypothetical protein